MGNDAEESMINNHLTKPDKTRQAENEELSEKQSRAINLVGQRFNRPSNRQAGRSEPADDQPLAKPRPGIHERDQKQKETGLGKQQGQNERADRKSARDREEKPGQRRPQGTTEGCLTGIEIFRHAKRDERRERGKPTTIWRQYH